MRLCHRWRTGTTGQHTMRRFAAKSWWHWGQITGLNLNVRFFPFRELTPTSAVFND
ncbi:hypothetical protein H6F76_25235 [Leptolyngbya sp. FACHB-321]|uniref:hypothetical protein n=1 Tax=Leptolyngbya sp. FACHB-321 TaxID=2692807 RepID=UPI001683201F|nr:hypothetical protein [Leptolyngbya sp. FACHB-321]MBD2038261.1 hypothetical protein [Leptolyngbya sp. FACHB-321]